LIPVITAIQSWQSSEASICKEAGSPVKPLALVLAPTRELCLQISKVTDEILSDTDFAATTSIPHFCAIGWF
jgi:superfamily II DNA/RNA helicase